MFSLVVFAAAITAALAGIAQDVDVTHDTLGNYKLKYVLEGISRVEQRDQLGNVNGGYAYIDPHGILRKTEFTSGVHGFHAVGTDIPVPVQDTPEVAVAKANHLSVLRASYLPFAATVPHLAPVAPIAAIAPAHVGIPETPAVLAARAEHFAAHAATLKTLPHLI